MRTDTLINACAKLIVENNMPFYSTYKHCFTNQEWAQIGTSMSSETLPMVFFAILTLLVILTCLFFIYTLVESIIIGDEVFPFIILILFSALITLAPIGGFKHYYQKEKAKISQIKYSKNVKEVDFIDEYVRLAVKGEVCELINGNEYVNSELCIKDHRNL